MPPAYRIGSNRLREIGRAMPAELDQICEATAKRIVVRSRASMGGAPGSAPGRPPGRVSGHLAAGFFVQKLGPARWAAGNAAPHAHLLERGTKERVRHGRRVRVRVGARILTGHTGVVGSTGRMAKRPFLRPAVSREARQFEADISAALRTEIAR